MAAVRSSTSDGGERVLTATSPPTFSMYERAMHESPDPELDGPMFAFEQSFAADEVMREREQKRKKRSQKNFVSHIYLFYNRRNKV